MTYRETVSLGFSGSRVDIGDHKLLLDGKGQGELNAGPRKSRYGASNTRDFLTLYRLFSDITLTEFRGSLPLY